MIRGLRAGMRFSTAHKEGGTHLFFNGQVFLRSDYGDFSSQKSYVDDAAMLECLRSFFDWDARRDLPLEHPTEA